MRIASIERNFQSRISDSENHVFELEKFIGAPHRELFSLFGFNIIGFVIQILHRCSFHIIEKVHNRDIIAP
jgi:hypothetical protein